VKTTDAPLKSEALSFLAERSKNDCCFEACDWIIRSFNKRANENSY
jgi:hypothetical protein